MTRTDPPRSRPLRFLALVLLALCAAVVVSKLAAPKDVVPWRDDLAAARAEAESAGKPVLAYFTADWCGPCQQMKRTTWADAGVGRALADYVPVRIDVDASPDLAMAYGVQGIPHLAVIEAGGEAVKSSTGYVGPGELVEWLQPE